MTPARLRRGLVTVTAACLLTVLALVATAPGAAAAPAGPHADTTSCLLAAIPPDPPVLPGQAPGPAATGPAAAAESRPVARIARAHPDTPSTPRITGIEPDYWLRDGGTPVTITGTDLYCVDSVTVDGIPVGPFTATGGTSVSFVSPTHADGTATVIVHTGLGDSNSWSVGIGSPVALTAVSPVEGPAAGGNPITLTGTGFLSAEHVLLDATPLAPGGYVVHNDTTITITAMPAHDPGPVTVAVRGYENTSTRTYTYLPPPPVVSGLSDPDGIPDDRGPSAGGETLVLTGRWFEPTAPAVAHPTRSGAHGTRVPQSPPPARHTPAAARTLSGPGVVVTFGGVPATAVQVDSPTQLTVVTPPHPPGTVAVLVTTPSGTGSAASYTYFAAPVVTAASAYTPPGVAATVLGSGFTGTESVTVGGVPALFVVLDDGRLMVTPPPGCHGRATLVATGPGGSVTAPLFCSAPPRRRHRHHPHAGAGSTGSLAATGADVGPLGLVGVLLVTLGGALVVPARRRTRS